MIRMIRSVLLTLSLASNAFAQPLAAAPELVPGSGVPAAVGQQFDATFRQALGTRATLVAAEPTAAALKSIGEAAPCLSDACGKKLAAALNARFVVSASVTAADDIYEVKLSVYDAAKGERSKVVSGTCELCTAGEVNGTITNAVGRLDEALKAPVAPPEPPKPVTVAFELKSTPSGAKVVVDGKEAGMTPVMLDLAPGSHTIQVTKQGFLAASRVVSLDKQPMNLLITLEPEKVAVVAPPTAPPVAPPTVAAAPPTAAPIPVAAPVTAEAPAPSGRGRYNGIAWGMTIGGAALAGVGTWLILLDGEVTCDDQGRSTCPTVYNTKGVGIAGLGIGSALIGAAIAIFAVGPGPEPVDLPAVEVGPGSGMLHWGGRF